MTQSRSERIHLREGLATHCTCNMATRAPSRPKFTSTDTVTVKAEDRAAATTLLLIGSTGNGKSTLGNFLLDPRNSHIFGKEQTFRTARDNKPETQSVSTQVTREQSGKRAVRIIDTPGLNESATQDLSHMIDIVKALNSVESISACILCMKFESKIDSQYKATVAYYRKLLPSLFEGNVVIVLTQFQTDPYSERQRELQGVDIDAIVTNAQKVVRKVADLSYYPQVFKIDSMPVMEDQREHSEGTRQAILDFIRVTMKPIQLSDLKVAKTDELKQIDDKKIEKVDGEIGGYNERLKQANSKAAKVLSRIERDGKSKSEHDRKLTHLKDSKEELDSTDEVTAKEWSLEQSWKFFQWQSKSFEIASAWPVVGHTKWDNGHLEWKRFSVQRDPGGAKGKVEGKFARGLYANVTLKTSKQMKYSDKIRSLNAEIRTAQERLDELKRNIQERLEEHQEYLEDIRLLTEYIDERNETKKRLSRDPIPIAEALQRLEHLNPEN